MTYTPYSSQITQVGNNTVTINLQRSITNIIYTINVQDLNLFISIYDPLGVEAKPQQNGNIFIKPLHLT